MRKCKLVLLTLMISLLFSACKSIPMLTDSDADIYAKIHNRFSHMTSYSSEVTMTVISNKTENKYELKQYFKAPDKMAAVYCDYGTKYIITETGAHLSRGESSAIFPANDDVNYLFLNEFFKIYYLAQDTTLAVLNTEGGGSTILETELTTPTAYRYRARLTINNKTLSPMRLAICDMSGNDVLYADYKSFIYNDSIDDSIFSS